MVLDQLRKVRKVRNLTIQEVSLRTRIPADCIEAIERGEWNYIGSPTKIKNYITIYARFLNINPAPIVRQFEKAKIYESIPTKSRKEQLIPRRSEQRSSHQRSRSGSMTKPQKIDPPKYINDSDYMDDRENLHKSNSMDPSSKYTKNTTVDAKSKVIPRSKESRQLVASTKVPKDENAPEKEKESPSSVQEYSGENRLSRRTKKKKSLPNNFWFYTGIGIAGIAVIIGTVLFLNGTKSTANEAATASTEDTVTSSAYQSDLRPAIKLLETIEKNNEADIYEISNVNEIEVTLEGKGKVSVNTGGSDASISSLVEGKIEEFHDKQYITVYLGSPQDVHLTVNGFVIDTSNYKGTATFRFQLASGDDNESDQKGEKTSEGE